MSNCLQMIWKPQKFMQWAFQWSEIVMQLFREPYVCHMSHRADFLSSFCCLEKKRLIHITPYGPSHKGSKRNLVLCPLSFSTICPFIVMKHRPAERQTLRKTKWERARDEEKKVKGVSGQSTGLVIWVTLGMIPPFSWGVALSAALVAPTPLECYTYTNNKKNSLYVCSNCFLYQEWFFSIWVVLVIQIPCLCNTQSICPLTSREQVNI